MNRDPSFSANARWQEALKQNDGTYSRRLTDDQAEIDFWHTFMEKKKEYMQDPDVAFRWQKLRELILQVHPASILELGPGWGNYTMGLADICESLTCVDISPDVLAFIRRFAGELGKHNIRTVQSKWEDYVPDRKYDVVFGYNCFYRMLDLAGCLQKINRTASSLCVIGMNVIGTEPFHQDMEQELLLSVNHDKKDYTYFVEILREMGIYPDVQVFSQTGTRRFESFEEVFRYGTTRLADRNNVSQKYSAPIEAILRNYFLPCQNGSYQYSYSYQAAIISWMRH